MKQLLGVLALLGLSFSCQAQWLEASGEATIINGDTSKARESAINNAISMVLLQNGGNFQASQTVNNGNLTSQLALSAASHIAAVELLNEQRQGNRLSVTIRADVQASTTAFDNAAQGLKAAVLVPQTLIGDRSQLRYGRLDKLPQVLSQHLAQHLQQAVSGFPVLLATQSLQVPQLTTTGNSVPAVVSEMTNSQYLLLPELMDVSVAPATASMLGMWANTPERQFQLRLTLYHGISGEIIWQQDYNGSAEWEFDKTAMVNPASDSFWQSAYGKHITQVLTQAVSDMDKALNRRPLLAQIIARDNNRIILNIGRQNGVKKGDTFVIVLQRNIADKLNKPHAIANLTPAKVTIDQLSEHTATALLDGENAAINIQLNDIAIKK
ncbi:flagellar assembly protein T N-terminal domain-containing protein [Shewanella sp. YIC-542]|uniref:flagellar assembly protein T N-terminal domain-containing protein n=1 Tax=Shewanella mytili TaxID=3377111 RepID=UPI00398F877F